MQIHSIKTVMFIDDDPIYNEINKLLFEKLYPDVAVMLATSADQAIDQLDKATHMPDIIFLDLNLPGKDGISFIDEYEKRWGSNNIYLLSSSSQLLNKKIQQSYHRVRGVIEKPLQEAKLAEIFTS